MNRHVEILAPAGSIDSLRAAVAAGADAVYIGGTLFGARAYAKNLTQEELEEAIDYVHIHGRKLYLTVNTLLKDKEMRALYDYLLPYYLRGLDGVIVQDVGVIQYIRQHFPKLPIHASTQMTITNTLGARYLKNHGIVRVVPARELSLEEIRKMKEETGLEMECFIHGAMCYCYSGQCLMSSMIGGRSGNRGQCAQPCRLPYRVGQNKPADVMSLKDLCTIDMIPELIEAGIDSFKIEGRMKQPDYVYTVVSMYRKYIDIYEKNGAKKYRVSEEDREQLYRAYRRRGYSEGYYRQHNGKNMISFKRPSGNQEESVLIPEYKLQEKINGNLILSYGERAKLVLECAGHQILCEGAEPQMASRQPLDVDRVGKQMRKTGNTEYIFDRLDIQMEDNLFLPMQALNELRREAISLLTEAILCEYRRTEHRGDTVPASNSIEERAQLKESGRRELSVLVRSAEQMRAAVGCEDVCVVYVDSMIGLDTEIVSYISDFHSAGKQVYLAMPYIFRESAIRMFENIYEQISALYDGVLVRNYETIEWLQEHGYQKPIRTDYNIYIFNRYSKAWVQAQGIDRCTAPVELNDKELRRLDIQDSMFIGYGYQPVMITANCMKKTTGNCDRKKGFLSIQDRYQKTFQVQACCPYCYNVIYNSTPLYLADQPEIIEQLDPAELRLDFTEETGKQTEKIIKAYAEAVYFQKKIPASKMEYTRGHIKRGVK